MKETIQLILVIILTFTLLFGTTELLSWSWVAAHWVRQALVIILVVVELILGFLVFRSIAKNLLPKEK